MTAMQRCTGKGALVTGGACGLGAAYFPADVTREASMAQAVAGVIAHPATTEDIAALAAPLGSDEASVMTGSFHVGDGGATAR